LAVSSTRPDVSANYDVVDLDPSRGRVLSCQLEEPGRRIKPVIWAPRSAMRFATHLRQP